MQGIKNSYIYVDGKGVIKTSLLVQDGRITYIGEIAEELPGLITLPEDQILVPGFIDQHIHGCFGLDTMEATPQQLLTMGEKLLQEGVTYFCPTTMTMAKKKIVDALKNIAKAKKMSPKGAEILGAHLEGPFLSPAYPGVQDPRYLSRGDKEYLEELLKAADDQIAMITFAPEEDGAKILPLINAHGITAAVGHSNATFVEAQNAFRAGASSSTHTFNAMRGIHHREIGTLGAVLLNDAVYAELIADLHHVNPEAIRLLFKVKGPEKIILVSDAIEAKYLPDGEYQLGGQKVFVKNGQARNAMGVLAGSILRLDQALRNIKMILPELTFTQLIDLVTKNPANNLKIPDIGSIKVGNRAKFTVVDQNLNVIKTLI